MSKPVEEGRQVALTDEEIQVSDHKGHSIEYDGVIYPSLSALAREKHISYGTMYRRLRMGMDLEQALQSNQRNHTIEYDGKIYPSIKALADEQQKVYSTLKARLERGMSVEKALQINNRLPSRKRRSVEYAGKMYPSIRSLAIERRMPYQTLRARLEKGMSVEEAIQDDVPRIYRGAPIEYAGKIYPSIKALAEEQQIPYNKLRVRLCRGMTVEEALSASGPSIEYGGKTYLSIKSLADELHVPYCRLRHRLKKGMAVDEALQNNRLYSYKGHPVEYKGKLYPSICSLAKELPIPYYTLLYRLKKGWSIEEALENNRPRGRRGDPIEYAGKTYPNSKALAEELQISYDILRYRLRKGMTIEEALDANKAENNIDIPKPTTGRAEPIPANAEDAFGAQDEGDINTEDEADEAAFIQTM